MHVHLTLDPPDTLVVHLREADEQTSVSVRPSAAGIRSLRRALEAARTGGYGECFWPGDPGGQYWWIFKRDGDTLETICMWTRGGASLWEHVFRATDSAAWMLDVMDAECRRVGRQVSGDTGV